MQKIIKKDGFSYGFDPSACDTCKGNCCIGESGYIWISKSEILALSSHLGMGDLEFVNEYLSKIGYRYTLKEEEFEGGYRCIFFDMIKRCCSVYNARPAQCRTFPFWDHFKTHQEEVEKECPGIYPLQ